METTKKKTYMSIIGGILFALPVIVLMIEHFLLVIRPHLHFFVWDFRLILNFLPWIIAFIASIALFFGAKTLTRISTSLFPFYYLVIAIQFIADFIRGHDDFPFFLFGMTLFFSSLFFLLIALTFGEIDRQIWVIPGILFLAFILGYTISFGSLGNDFVVRMIPFVPIYFYYPYWVTRPERALPDNPKQTSGHINMALHILLLFFTLRIWKLIWIYKTTNYLNCTPGEPYRNPAKKLLLFIFIPFYHIYWTYKSAQYIDHLAASKRVPSDISALCLVLELFIPIIPPIIIQSKINSIARGYVAPVAFVPTNYAPFNNPSVDYAPTNDTVVPATPVAPVVAPVTAPVSPAPMTQSDAADALRRFKELLDSGVITQEEFNAKKKQLLGL